LIGYFCLGNAFTPELLILRKAYPNKPIWSERIFQILLSVYFAFLILSMPIFNITLRDYVFEEFQVDRNKFNFKLVSLLPFVLSVIVCTLVPQIIIFWNFLSITVYNFNGYMIPIILKMSLQKRQQKSYLKYAFFLGLCLFAMIFSLGHSMYHLILK
jgi:hypothetical protein